MLKSYLKIALRILRRYKAYSFINIAGLAVGMAGCLLILAYVRNELSYDRYHKNAGRIYRVVEELNIFGKKSHMAITPAPFGPAMETEFKEVIKAVRFVRASSSGNKILIRCGNENYYERDWFFVDDSVFEVFSFPLVQGDPKTALKDPNAVVITEDIAKKYFGADDPLGKILTVQDRYGQSDFKITGVLRNIRKNSHFRFDFLASFITFENQFKNWLQNWFNHMYYTYLLLEKGTDPGELETKFPEMLLKHAGKMAQLALKPHLQPLTSIHLHSHLESEIEANSDIVYVYVFSAIAIFILIIACINFMNLATARSAYRAREVGLRKVVGARRSQLVKQFLGESVLFSLIALPLAVVMMELLLTPFGALMGKKLDFNYGDNWLIILALIGITLFVGFVSGIYPALFLSGFQPIKILKGTLSSGSKNANLRQGLIVFQFAISIALIISVGVIRNQVNYIRTKNLGFDKEHVVVLPLREKEMRAKYEAIRNEFMKSSRVLNVSASSGIPGRIVHYWYLRAEGIQDLKKELTMWILMVDHNFVKTLGMDVVEGRDFSVDFETDEKEAIILNESAVKKLGWESPLGKNIKTENKDGYVIGVVKDFHYQPLYQRIEPLVLYISPGFFEYVLVRIAPDNVPAALDFLKEKWRELAPHRPFEYFFLDSDFDSLYRSEERTGKLVGCFTVLAVFVSCLGLSGLASFTAEQRTKEIGIRKVLGASVAGIVALLSKEFTRWVLVANIIAWPGAYWVMSRWLQNFAYRTSFGIGIFFLSALIAFVIALTAVSYQAVKAAIANPVEALRYE